MFIARSLAVVGLVFGLGACAGKTADKELSMADTAIRKASSSRARECAPELHQAAEQALADARRLASAGDVDAAISKATQAEALAQRAEDASPPGCETALLAEDVEAAPELGSADGEEASRGLSADREALAAALDTIYFDYNQYVIREESKPILTEVADLLRRLPNQSIDIEGHCDVRGSTEYNLHLGERRARSVLKYLVTQGVSPDQLRIISFGEERPADFGFTEAAHAANRRAELRGP